MMRLTHVALFLCVFVLSGSIALADDKRSSIKLSVPERDFVLAEMRSFLAGVQQIIAGVTADDMQKISEAARVVGMHTAHQVPGSLKSKLPMDFKKLGFDTHTKFDQMALDAKQVGEKALVLEQLSQLMENCVTCHSMYRFDLEAEK